MDIFRGICILGNKLQGVHLHKIKGVKDKDLVLLRNKTLIFQIKIVVRRLK